MKRLFLISASLTIASASFAQSGCVTAPVNISGSQLTLTSSGDKSVTNNEVLIYYSRKHPKRHWQENTIASISDKYHSVPVMLSTEKSVSATPETYNVTLSTP